MPVWLGILLAIAAVVLMVVALWVKWRLDNLITDEVQPALRELKKAAKNIDVLADDARRTLGRIDKAAAVITTVASVASATSKVVAGPRSTVMTVLAGVKEGLRILRKSEESKEVTEDDGE